MSFPNKFDGPCSACGVHVHPGEGAYAWRQLYCRFHDPDGAGSTSRKHTINVSAHGAGAALKPAGFLGSDGFAAWRAATNACKNVKGADGQWTTTSTLDALPGVLEALRGAGFQLQIAPALAATLQARAARTQADLQAAGERAQAVDAALKARGLALFPFQATGIDWLAQRDGALLGDEMGCIDGSAQVRISRAGKGFALSLRDLYSAFHGGKRSAASRRTWNPSIPTYIRSLCDGELRLNLVHDVLDKGERPVVQLTLASGKTLLLTPDHEVATPKGFVRADRLVAGADVLTNGQPRCKDCGGTEQVITSSSARFVGSCRKCMYRKHRDKPTWKGGRSIDKDGYVRTAGQQEHPRANRAGQVYEHVLVMEKHLGRFVGVDEVVHHKNGDKTDNRIENLELTTPSAHMADHGREGGYRRLHGGRGGKGGLVTFTPKLDQVISVEACGVAHVYDVVCADPHRNFVANGIVVHNCGKTIQALVAAPTGAPVLVVCPAVAKGVWQREAAKWRPDLRVVVLSGRGSFRWPTAGEMVIVNYDILPTGCEVPAQGTVLVCDEAHAIKNSKATRTQRVRFLSEAVRARAGKVWLLTATPLLGKPQELWSVLQAAGVANEVFGSWKRFVILFNGVAGEWGGYIWGRPFPEVPELLKRAMLRREKAEVLKDLPAKRRQDYVVELSAKDLKALDKLTAEICKRLGTTPEGLAQVLRDGVPMFEEMSRARTLLAGAKIPALLALVESYEEQEEPLVVFSAHRAPIDILAGREGWATITGDTKDKNAVAEAFQRGELRGIACTIGAGGTAVTLTRASNMVMVDLDWTPALNAQAEDRIHRIGTQRPVLITRLVAAHALDERVMEVLAEKQGIINASTEAASRGAEEKVVVKQATLRQDEMVARQAEKASAFNRYAVDSGMTAAQIQGAAVHEFLADLREGAQGMAAAEDRHPRRGPVSPEERWAARGLLQLAGSDPDRAAEKNDVGFNRLDGDFGHSLAAQLETQGLTDAQWRAAVKLCRTYHRQIGECP